MKTWKSLLSIVVLLSAAFPVQLLAGDWPQFRYDARRSAASAEQLPKQLHLQWVRESAAPRPAFPSELQLRYDATYQPVVMGKRMFVPSMVTDSVTALDTDAGAVRWRFFADGPIRFAPVVWKDRVFFVSDDGHLYCVSATDGNLLWKFRGLPANKQDRLVFGDRRLVSLWVARGGPVLKDGVVYFGAGLWLGDGTFVHALDAMTGKVVWSNTDSNIVAKANLDHGSQGYGGVSPQGYLAVVAEKLGEKLIVPCGVQLPALFDPKTGDLEPYTAGWGGRPFVPKGSWFVAGSGKYLISTGDLYDITRTNDERIPGRGIYKSLLYPGRYTRVLVDPGHTFKRKAIRSFRQPILTDDTIFFSGEQGIEAFDLTQPRLAKRSDARRYSLGDTWQANFPKRWRLKSKLRIHIKAGNRLYAGGDGVVAAVDIPAEGQAASVSWQAPIDGTPGGMLAADGKLFVVTRQGKLYAFGPTAVKQPETHRRPAGKLNPPHDPWSALASQMLKESKVADGYALVLGVGEGRLAEELVRQSRLSVIGVDPDGQRIDRLRRRFHRLGLYGTRITLRVGLPSETRLPPYMASLIVTEDPKSCPTPRSKRQWQRFLQPLRPYGGTAFVPMPRDERQTVAKKLAVLVPAKMTVRSVGQHVAITRPGALPATADWTHAGGDAANTGASQDLTLKPPLATLWWDGSMRWFGAGAFSAVRVAKGRVFVLRRTLTAYDAYTGQRLWETWGLKGWNLAPEFVATNDAIYIPEGQGCRVVDSVTGKRLPDIRVPKSITDHTKAEWKHAYVSGDHLLGTVGQYLVCINRRTGSLGWSFRGQHQQLQLSVAVGGGRVFMAEIKAPNRRPTEEFLKSKPRTQAFVSSTGKQLWSIPNASETRYSAKHALLVTTHGIYRAKDGTLLRKSPPLFYELGTDRFATAGDTTFSIAGETIVHNSGQRLTTYSLSTGRKLIDDLEWQRRGCTFLRSCPTFVTTRFRGNAGYIDLKTQGITPIWNIRSGCNNNLFPAGGVLNVPCLTSHCTCNYLPASTALIPAALLDGSNDKEESEKPR